MSFYPVVTPVTPLLDISRCCVLNCHFIASPSTWDVLPRLQNGGSVIMINSSKWFLFLCLMNMVSTLFALVSYFIAASCPVVGTVKVTETIQNMSPLHPTLLRLKNTRVATLKSLEIHETSPVFLRVFVSILARLFAPVWASLCAIYCVWWLASRCVCLNRRKMSQRQRVRRKTTFTG